MEAVMDVSHVMSRSVRTVRQDAALAEAIALMVDHRISGTPVVDSEGQLIGMLTEGDLLRRAEVGTGERHRSGLWNFLRGPGLNAEEYVHAHSSRVEDLMTRDPVAVVESTPLEDVVALMESKRIK